MHVATVVDGGVEVRRDDDDPWSAVPSATGGVLWRAHHPQDIDVTTRETMEEWVRPKRIDHARLLGVTTETDFPESFEEGASFEDWSISASAFKSFTVQGKLWSRTFSARIDTNAADAKLSSALVFGSDLLSELSEPEMMTLAMRGRAVSPVTSYLAIEPGVRPSTEGLDWGVSGTGSGSGFGNGSGRLFGGHAGPNLDKVDFLRKALAGAANTCGARGDVLATIETTVAEIVDVHDVEQSSARNTSIESCITEAMWAVTLPLGFRHEHERFELTVKL